MRAVRWLQIVVVVGVAAGSLTAQEVILPETKVTAERLLGLDPSFVQWDELDLKKQSPRAIDELLATEPSFSLYRRQTSIFGHPTSSGVGLRRTGATATARTLVLRDGIPQNDPFGGWISWGRYPVDLLSGARIVPASQAAGWGNQSPAGVVQLSSREPVHNETRLQVIGGTHGTYGMSAGQDLVNSEGTIGNQVAVFGLHSDGFFGLSKHQRGVVDRRLSLETKGAEWRGFWQPVEGVVIEPMLSIYDEERGNGTVLSRNATDALDASVRITREGVDATWQALVYYQRRRFSSLFSSVNAARSVEGPALDQFDVPGEGAGGALTVTLHLGEEIDVMVGADVRHVRGETNEDAGFVNGAFLRRRRAGGEQWYGGIFGQVSYAREGGLSVDASARVDLWTMQDGARVERRPATGALLRNDQFSDREGVEPSLSVSLRQEVADGLQVHASMGTSFRLPTINELYRPFRVRNDITEANPALDPERFFSAEVGMDWRFRESVEVRMGLFHHWIDDAIANVPITDPVEAAAIAGFVPPGGSVAQRRNVEEARVYGVESKVTWQVIPGCALSLSYLLSYSEFQESAEQPLLEGKRFPQAPRHRLVAGIEGKASERVELFAQVDIGSSQYDDALEHRKLASWSSTRLGARVALTEDLSLNLRVENLFDEKIITGHSSSGLESIGQPRSFWANLRYRF